MVLITHTALRLTVLSNPPGRSCLIGTWQHISNSHNPSPILTSCKVAAPNISIQRASNTRVILRCEDLRVARLPVVDPAYRLTCAGVAQSGKIRNLAEPSTYEDVFEGV